MAGINLGDATGRPSQPKVMADINVTPLVDVMLVLLIIFMVTAPLLVSGVPIELPKNSAQKLAKPSKPLIVTLSSDKRLYIGDEEVNAPSLVSRLAALRPAEGDPVIYLRADKKIPYGDVMELLGALNAFGFKRISLLSQQKEAGQEPSGKAAP